MTSLVIFMPVIVVALGALVSLAAEPFMRDESKHKVLPWVAAVFLALGIASYALTDVGSAYDLFVLDPVRRMLGVTVLLCAMLGIGGLQWMLGREKYKGGEAYGK